jgi:hypothetical protein
MKGKNCTNGCYIVFNENDKLHIGSACSAWKVYNTVAGKPEGKRPLGRPRHRW